MDAFYGTNPFSRFAISHRNHSGICVDGAVFQMFNLFLFLAFPTYCCLTLRVMDAFKTFDLIFVLTKGGPGLSTEVLSFYTYKYGFKFFHMGRASALSYILFLILFVITQFFLKYYRTGVD